VSISPDSSSVAVWLSTDAAADFAALFEPNASAYEGGVDPIDSFAALVGTRYYDHDLLERSDGDSLETLGELIAQFSQGANLLKQLACAQSSRPARNLALLYGYRASVQSDSSSLCFIANLTLQDPMGA